MLGRMNEANPEKEAFLAQLNRMAVNVDACLSQPEFKKSGFASSKKNASIYALLINIIEIAQLERVITKSDIRIEKLMEIVYSKLNVLTQQSDFFTHDCEAAYYVLFVNMTLVSPKIKECRELLQGLRKNASPGELIILNKIERMLDPSSQNAQKNPESDNFDEIKQTPLNDKGRVPDCIIRFMQIHNAYNLLIKITSHTHDLSSYLNKIAEFARMQYLPKIMLKIEGRTLFNSFELIYEVRQYYDAFFKNYIVITDPDKSLIVRMGISLMQLYIYFFDRVKDINDHPFNTLLDNLSGDALAVTSGSFYTMPPDEVLPFWKTMIRISLSITADDGTIPSSEYMSLYSALHFLHDIQLLYQIKTLKEKRESFSLLLGSLESKYNLSNLKPGFIQGELPILVGILPIHLLRSLTALKGVITSLDTSLDASGLQKNQFLFFQKMVLKLAVLIGADSSTINAVRGIFIASDEHGEKKAEEAVLPAEKSPAMANVEIALEETDKFNKTAESNDEEKKSELDKPDFVPHQSLTKLLKYYSSYLDHNEEKVEMQSKELYKLSPRELKTDFDENNNKLIHLLYRLINLTEMSQDSKKNNFYKPELFFEIEIFFQNMMALKDNRQFLLRVLLHDPHGRDFLYHVVLQRLIRKEPDKEFTRFLIRSLKKTSDKTVEEGITSEYEVLEYLEFTLDATFKQPASKQKPTYLENKLVIIHKNLDLCESKDIKERIEFFNQMKCNPLNFSKKVRKLVAQFVTINLGFIGIKDLDKNTPELVSLTTELSVKNYYPAVLSEGNSNTLDCVVFKIINFSRYVEVYAAHHAWVNAPDSNILQTQLVYLKIQMIQIISTLPSLGCIRFNDFKIISDAAPYLVINDCLKILKGNAKLEIYDSMIKMLLFLLPSHANDFYHRVDKIINSLFINKKCDEVRRFLTGLSESDHPNKKIYASFLRAINFLGDIVTNKNKLGVILESIMGNKYDFSALTFIFLSEKFKVVTLQLKQSFLLLIQSLDIAKLKQSADTKHFSQFQQTILKLAGILGVDETELSALWVKIEYNPESVLDDLALTTNSTKSGKKVNQKKQPNEKKSVPVKLTKAAPKQTAPEVSKNKSVATVQKTTASLTEDDFDTGGWEEVTKNKKHDNKKLSPSSNEKKPDLSTKQPTVSQITKPAVSITTSKVQSTSNIQHSTAAITKQTSINIKVTTINAVGSVQETQTPVPSVHSTAQTTLTTSASTQSTTKTTNLAVSTPIPTVTQVNVSTTNSTTTTVSPTPTPTPTVETKPAVVTTITPAPILKTEQQTAPPVTTTVPQQTQQTVTTVPATTTTTTTKEVAASPLLSGTLFKAANEDKTLVEQKRLPVELLIFSEFYYNMTKKTLTLVDGAVACLLSINEYPLIYDMIACSDGNFLHYLLVKAGYKCEFNDADIPVIVVSIPVNIQGNTSTFRFNISCCGEHANIIQFLAARDIDLDVATLSMQLVPKAGCFKINGPTQAFKSLFYGVMSPAHDRIYEEELTRIFQLVLRRGKFPALTMNHNLVNQLTAIPALFDKFIYGDVSLTLTHLRQIGTHIDITFSTLDPKLAVLLLCKCNTITGLIGLTKYNAMINSAGQLEKYMSIFNKDEKKTPFYHFLYMHAWFSDEPTKKMDLFNIIIDTLEQKFDAPAFKKHLEIIENKDPISASRRFPYVASFVPVVEFTNMLNFVAAEYQQADPAPARRLCV